MVLDIDLEKLRHGTTLLKRGFARMQKGGVVMDVTDADQARIAEEAGAVAVMALERVPADIRAQGGVARMADPVKVLEIIDTVSIPVMAKARIGHFAEAQVLEVLGVDMIDESEVLTPADPFYHIDKKGFTVPFVCGAEIQAPYDLVAEVAGLQRLPVVNFAAGGIATPADAALMMQLGVDGVFVGSGIFKSRNPQLMAKAIVEATTNFDDPKVIADVSKGLGDAMPGINIDDIPLDRQLQHRGW